ncbi:MAG: SDR family oxidoreductase [Moorea sp. SIOASIH]|uniref:SDR family oxidoreductase n=1 Tax=Moorena sp. SIOASIH TaxID=2607817 RepID=UPI0013BBD3F7|nr:SDR family oxidoreductase [Moorena sp. SIOASIH]NEO40839.1 SDR family oxidoreductase [Moorena sp. SIOASIH]
MDLGLTGKIALVTGASAGIGYAIADRLAGEGCKLIICGRNRDRLKQAEQVFQTAGIEMLSICADVQQPNDSQKLVDSALSKFGKIDILVNNSAGANFAKNEVEEMSDQDWRTVFEGKLLGYIRMTNLVLPTMKTQKWGRIINIVGTSGKEPSGTLIKSGVANAGLVNFTKAVANQVARYNILVNCVNPGIIDTPRHQDYLELFSKIGNKTADEIKAGMDNKIPLGRRGEAMEVGTLVAFLASECASYITGISIAVDGGLSVAAF